MELHVCVLLFAMILYLYVLMKLVLNIYKKGGGVKMSQYIRWWSGLNILYGNKISEIETRNRLGPVVFFLQINIFCVFRSFWCADVKNNF
jgi:hypothetical protein